MDKSKKAMHDEVHIGKLIFQKLKEKERSVAWLARQISCDDGNLGRQLKNSRHIHAELLLRISIALEEDLFACYSEAVASLLEDGCKKHSENQ